MITTLYGISGIISMFAYFPTIKDLLHGIPSANFTTYFLWLVYYGISVLYGIFVLYDWLFIVVSGIDALIILVIVILVVRVKRGAIVAIVSEKKAKVIEKMKGLKRRKKTCKIK
jgi:hypothetical protein